MVRTEKLGEWTTLLEKETQAFCQRQSPERARNMLMLCACVEAAITGYLIRHKMEGVIYDDKS